MNRKLRLPLLFILLLVVFLAACRSRATEAPEADVAQITLERRPCFGFCPVYTLTIHGDGRVEYNGTDNVEVTGPQTATIDPATVQSLGDAIARAGYLDFEDAYTNQDVTDLPSAITSITFADGTTKRIEHYHGDQSAPEVLTQLEDRIDETANSAQWVGEAQP